MSQGIELVILQTIRANIRLFTGSSYFEGCPRYDPHSCLYHFNVQSATQCRRNGYD